MTATIADVASLARVSPATVSKLLNTPNRVSPETTERIRSAISELGYVRNDAARQLRAGNSRTIGLLAYDVENPFFVDLVSLITTESATSGMFVLLANGQGSVARDEEYLRLFEEQRVRGLLVAPSGEVPESLARIHQQGIPVVLLDREDPQRRVPSVSFDDRAGGALAAGHLISRGCRRLAFAGDDSEMRQVHDRLDGARSAVEDTPGVTLEVIDTGGRTTEHGRAVAERVLARPASQRPDGIFAVNDRVAVGLLQTLVWDGGISVPEDIAVIGYDDIEFGAAAVVPLTTVHQPKKAFARAAVQMLFETSELPQQLVIEPRLVVRESTRRRRSQR